MREMLQKLSICSTYLSVGNACGRASGLGRVVRVWGSTPPAPPATPATPPPPPASPASVSKPNVARCLLQIGQRSLEQAYILSRERTPWSHPHSLLHEHSLLRRAHHAPWHTRRYLQTGDRIIIIVTNHSQHCILAFHFFLLPWFPDPSFPFRTL